MPARLIGSNAFAFFKFLEKNKNSINNFEFELKKHYYSQNSTSLVDYDVLFYDNLEPQRFRRNQLVMLGWDGFSVESLGLMCKENVSKCREFHVSSVIKDVDLVLSSSKMFEIFFSACFTSESSKYVLTGMPRNDFLFSSREEALIKLKKLTNFNFEGKKVVLYIPTMCRLSFEKDAIFDALEEILQARLLKQINFVLILICDFNEEKFIFKDFNSSFVVLNNKLLKENSVDLYECLAAVDVLITDYSSTAYDWLLTHKPIIHYIPNHEEYEKYRGFLFEPIDEWLPGKITDKPNDLIISLEEALLERFVPDGKYIRLKNMVHHFQDENSCERVLKFLQQYYEGENS